MKVRDLIEKLETMDGDTEILVSKAGHLEILGEPAFWDERFVAQREDGSFEDVTDKERDHDILAIVLR